MRLPMTTAVAPPGNAAQEARPPTPPEPSRPEHGKLLPLATAALGVGFGDLSTSPLYAIKECFAGAYAQRRGTARIGRVFGPVMMVWFLAIAALGLRYLIHAPDILEAVNPLWAIRFFKSNGFFGFELLGAVVLCITGGEALYADMGHF